MKTSRVLCLLTIALALTSIGCSASGRINVKNDSASKVATDVQVAYVTKTPTAR